MEGSTAGRICLLAWFLCWQDPFVGRIRLLAGFVVGRILLLAGSVCCKIRLLARSVCWQDPFADDHVAASEQQLVGLNGAEVAQLQIDDDVDMEMMRERELAIHKLEVCSSLLYLNP